jgi:magnesium transporter
MQRDVISARLDEDQESVARKIDRYDLFAIPVVDAADMLVGIVTHDDANGAAQADLVPAPSIDLPLP